MAGGFKISRGRLAAVSSGGIATVGPASGFTGTAGSGGSAPTGAYALRADSPDPTKPMTISQIATCPGQRMASTFLLKIPCDGYGGVTQVNLSGDCAATTITSMAKVDFVDVNGVSHPEFYHAVYIDTAAFVAKGGADGSRRANIYAEVVPTNGALNKRLLSFHFFPASTATDGTYNVGSGQTYSTIRAALSQARTDGKKAPLIQIKTTGNYEMEDSTWGIYTSGQGFAVITHDPGIIATIGRAAAFNPTNQASWKWTPGWDGIEFRGSGIVLDIKNMTDIVMSAKPCLLNGCKVTNSIGTRDSLYWNKSPHPGFNVNASWWQYTDLEYGMIPNFQLGFVGTTSRWVYNDMYTGTPLVYGAHDENASAEWFRQGVSNSGIPCMTVRYSGTGTGTVARPGGNGGGWLVLSDGNHPGADLTIDLGAVDNLVQISDVAATINARSGWTATVTDNTRAARYLRGFMFGDVNGFTDTDAKSADLPLASFIDVHGDGTQTYGGSENYIYWNWTLDTGVYMSNVLFFDGETNPVGTLGDRDMSFVNCVLIADQSGTVGLGGPGAHHKLFHHLTTNLWLSPSAGTQEVYTEMTNCIMAAIGGGSGAQPVNFRNNVHTIPNGEAAPSGSTYIGNVALGNYPAVSPLDFLTSVAGHNFKPTSTALTTLYANVFPWDRNGVVRSTNDCAGAVSKNAA